MRIIYIYVVGIILLLSCTTKKNQNTITINLDEGKELGYSSIIENIEYVILESDGNRFPINVEKIVKKHNKYYISTQDHTVFIYNLDGSFSSVIDAPGDGPGSIRSLDDFNITDDQIIIKDGYLKKILFFDLNGNYLNEKKDLFPTSYIYYSSNYRLYYPHNDPTDGQNSIYRISKEGKVEGFLQNAHELGTRVYLTNSFNEIASTQEIFLGLPITSEIAYFDKNGYPTKTFKINFGKNEMPMHSRLKFENRIDEFMYIDENNLIDAFSKLFPLSKNTFMMVVTSGMNSPNIIICSRLGEVLFNSSNFYNDYEGLENNTIPWTYTGDELISWNTINVLHDSYLNKKPGILEVENSTLGKFLEDHSEAVDGEDIVLITSKIKKEYL